MRVCLPACLNTALTHPIGATPMPACSRRHFLASATHGVGTLACAWLLNQEGLLRAEPSKPDLERKAFDLKPRAPHFEPRARAMISLFMQGGPSHMDLLDPKPELDKL